MNTSGGLRRWHSVSGVVVLAWLVCGVPLRAAPPGQGDRRSGPPVAGEIRYAPPVHAYRTSTVLLREGGGVEPLSLNLDGGTYRASVAGVATISCRANSDCDDCNPCTTDVCTVVPPSINGTCSNDPVTQCGSCSDQDFCNGPELCDAAGICRDPAPGTPCGGSPGTICDELGGPAQRGECLAPCQSDLDCLDELECNGIETCELRECVDGVAPAPGTACSADADCDTANGGFCGGVCRAGSVPCGLASACKEQYCSAGSNAGAPCTTNGDCGLGGQCQVGADCVVNGRCCADDGSGDFLTCTRSNKSACITLGGRWLFIGDDPGSDGDEANCARPAAASLPNAGETFNCPNYASGIDADLPLTSLVPVGRVGAASCNMMQEVGDDYGLAGLDLGEYLEVTTFRFIGGFQTDGIPGSASRIRVTFYDAQGNFIEDTITNTQIGGGNPQLRTIIFAEKPKIPANGFVAVRAAVRFSPFGKHTWMGGVSAADTGANSPNVMWLNGAAVDASLVMGGSPGSPTAPGILAFEIAGNIIENPSGACCDSATGACDLVLPWLCEQTRCSHDQNVPCTVDGDCGTGNTCLPPGFFQGAQTQCQACSNDPFSSCSSSANCPSCSGEPGTCEGDPGSTACAVDADCIPFGAGRCLLHACNTNTDCPGGVCTGTTCVGGSNDGNACDPDVDCVGGGTCTGTEDCDPAPPACTREACCADTPDGTGGIACIPVEQGAGCPPGHTSRGFGTNCDPNLCEHPSSGYDTCVEAALPGNLHAFDVASLEGCETLVWTATGNNLNAAFGDFVGDGSGTCEFGMFAQDGAFQDRGWWHAFTINACANVRMDFCGTAELYGEVKEPAWANLWAACNPCGATVSSSVVGGLFEGGCVGSADASGDRGGPFCARDDLWQTYGPLRPGTYWYPVFSGASGTFGQYQIHFSVSACAKSACCLPEDMCVKVDDSLVFDGAGSVVTCADDAGCAALQFCDNALDVACTVNGDCPACVGGPTPDAACTVDADCGTGGTCSGTSTCRAATCGLCALANSFDCQTALGKWNGFGSTRTQCPGGSCEAGTCVDGEHDGEACDPAGSDPITSCLGGPCDIGSCCTGAALCQDQAIPGTPCNPANPTTCLTRAECTVGTFRGSAGCADLVAPCPACEMIGDTNCQFPLGSGLTYTSDLSLGENGVTVADDFEPSGNTLDRVCVWGTYMDPSGPSPSGSNSEEYSCVGLTVGEQFRIRVFEDGALDADPNTPAGLPGTMVGQSLVSAANIVSGPERGTTLESTYGIVMQSYTLTLDTPITGLSVGARHWLEVVNYTPIPEGNTCWWSWAQHIPEGRHGHVAVGISPAGDTPDDLLLRPSVYVNGSSRGGTDMAFCLSMDFAAPDDPIGACWNCATVPGCQPRTLADCSLQTNVWDRTDPSCLNAEPPPQTNDFCKAGGAAGAGMVASMLTCGDGIIDPGEQCDPPSPGLCTIECQLECVPPVIVGGDGALKISDGLYPFDNACANVDGPSLVATTGGDEAMDGDIWYAYTASCTGKMSVDSCPTQTAWNRNGYSGIDAELAVYHEDQTSCDGGSNSDAPCVCPGNPPRAKCIDTVQCPGTTVCDEFGLPAGCSNEAIGMCRNLCPCPGQFSGVSPLQHSTGSDEGCNGIADAGSGYLERTVFPNECWLIRVGSWMPAGSQPGTGSRGRGLMSVGCEGQICFPSSPPLQELGEDTGTPPPLVAWNKSRMLSIEGGDAGRLQAIRVKFTALPPGWTSWIGQSLFVQEPWLGSEKGGTSFYDPPPPGDETLQLAELDCQPYFTDWSTVGVVHVIHPALVPSLLLQPAGPVAIPALYTVQLIDDTCPPSLEASYSDPLVIRTAAWADVTELDAGTYRVPGDNVSVVDTLAMVAKFAGDPNAPSKANASLLGVTAGPEPRLDGKITISETVSVLGAFSGENYPFTEADTAPPPGQCPP